jgi:hypothetical protein
MSEDKGEIKEALKVVDRRRFDESGNQRQELRPLVDNSEPKATQQRQAASDTPSQAQVDSASSGKAVPLDFSGFVVSLATQTLMQLGELKAPAGMEIAKDLVMARHSIDILDMLKLKTKGNLNADESRLLEEVLHNLHIAFVRASSIK